MSSATNRMRELESLIQDERSEIGTPQYDPGLVATYNAELSLLRTTENMVEYQREYLEQVASFAEINNSPVVVRNDPVANQNAVIQEQIPEQVEAPESITQNVGLSNPDSNPFFDENDEPNNGYVPPVTEPPPASRDELYQASLNKNFGYTTNTSGEPIIDADAVEEIRQEQGGTLNPAVSGPSIEERVAASEVAHPEENLDTDWRVRLSLGEGAGVLYQDPDPGILWPLSSKYTGGKHGITFPYTPQIGIQYVANYENYDLIHSNHRGYFYRNSVVNNVMINATFTAQDTSEANYVLACLHFLRSCTKMFYGEDENKGLPPPLVYLHGYGEYGFNKHACAVTNMQYNLPNDVDYIPAGKPQPVDPTGTFETSLGSQSGHVSYSQAITRLISSGLLKGASGNPKQTDASQSNQNVNDYKDDWLKVYEGNTYVPTKIDVNFTLIPINTRTQVSTEFSLKDYASGKLLNPTKSGKSGGFW